MNPFQHTYDHRLREWKNLRLMIRGESLDTACAHVDHWWQQAPLITHHIHPLDQENWPDPWTILSENIYCPLTRALGMCYTLLMSDIYNIQLIQAHDVLCEDHNLVVVGPAKYVLNYYPNSVLSTNLTDFKINNVLSLEHIQQKIK